jgi:Rrf2 family iron-sulfur cluster assembly transcriptional regulator
MSALVPPAGEYALRACACLAAAPGRALTARELAIQAHVPAAFLAKVLRRLVANGLLEAHKGHHGGFRLARAPREIRLGDLLRAAEVELNPPHCAFGFARCDAKAPCPLHEVYTRMQSLCHMWAQATTLDQLDLHRLQAGGDLSLEVALASAAAEGAPGADAAPAGPAVG